MFKRKKKTPQFNSHVEQSAFTVGLQYRQLMDEIEKHDTDIMVDIYHNEKGKIISAADIFKNEK